jgi:hypothetical protein
VARNSQPVWDMEMEKVRWTGTMSGLRMILEKKLIQKIPVNANRGKRICLFPLECDASKIVSIVVSW